MRKSTKSIAIVLVLAMVVCAFCATLSASAESENILKGLSYTVETDMSPLSDATADTDNTFLTDGAYRGDATHAWGDNVGALANVTREFSYGSRSASVVFAFDGAKNISTIIVRGVRAVLEAGYNCNRCTGIQSIQVTTDGDSYSDTATDVKYVACAGAPEMKSNDESSTAPQFYDIYITVVGAADVTGLKVNLNATNPGEGTSGDLLQLDEIEAYAEAVQPPVVEESSAAAETSDAAAETSEAAAETSVAAPETSEEPAKVADVTFKVSAVENADGTVTVTVTIPDDREDVNSGKVVLAVSDKLTFVDVNAAGVNGTVNKAYSTKDAAGNAVNGVCVSFASAESLAKGTVVATFTYNKAEGAELSAADITVPEWNISDVNGQKLGQTGWVTKRGEESYIDGGLADVTFTGAAAAESSETSGATSETSAATSEASGATSEASGATSEASGATSETSGATSETSAATSETSNASAGETSQGGGSGSDKTGDAGVIAFAVLAVISGAAVVVLKKRA